MSSNKLPVDNTAIAEASSFARHWENTISEIKRDFEGKCSFDLLWDSKQPDGCSSFPWISFGSSDKEEVMEYMEKYRAFYEEIVNFTNEDVNDDNAKVYENLLGIYGKIKVFEKDANRDINNTTSSALYKMLKQFLSSTHELEYCLKNVERVALERNLAAKEKACLEYKSIAEDLEARMNILVAKN